MLRSRIIEHFFAIFALSDSIAQRSAKPVENGGLQQEAADMFRLVLKNLFDQIVQHKTVAAGESLYETGDVFPALHGECGQLQTGDPAFGAGLQRGEVFR